MTAAPAPEPAAGPRLTVLGAGSILPRAGYGCSGYALRASAEGPVTLLDCGPGTVRALGAAGIGLERVGAVVLSHFHPDHCLDLLALAFARRNPALREAPRLDVVGPRGLRRWWSDAAGALGRWVEDPAADVRECGADFAEGERVRCGEWELRAAPTGHTPEALAWRAEGAGTSVCYSGDTGEAPAVAELAAGVELFVAECSFPTAEAQPHHLTPPGAARLARRAGCRRLLLSHFYPSVDPSAAVEEAAALFAGSVGAARDGSVHAL